MFFDLQTVGDYRHASVDLRDSAHNGFAFLYEFDNNLLRIVRITDNGTKSTILKTL